MSSDWFVPALLRAVLVLVCLLLALVRGDVLPVALFLFAAAGFGMAALVVPSRPVRLVLFLAEAGTAALGAATEADPSGPLFVYLPGAIATAGLRAGGRVALLGTGLAAAVLLAGRLDVPDEPAYTLSSASWILISLLTAVLAARIRLLDEQQSLSAEDRYEEAYRLLAQLRAVTEGLPGSLDPGSVATSLLDHAVAVGRADQGAVLMQVGGDQLVPVALHGYRRVPWRAELDEEGPISQAWRSRATVQDTREAGGRRAGSALLVLPLASGPHMGGVLVLESRKPGAFPPDVVQQLEEITRHQALPLETAALFDELRMSAAAEERSRLAREMHDGIAQDLAYLGYEIDGLTSALRTAPPETAIERSRQLRGRLTELISELRLSISDLRSSVGPGRGLGAALSQYARSVGTSTGMTVHLTLTEGSMRLPVDVEVQLLRIAYELINRARRRPGTQNLWVTLAVDPPLATLLVEDDSPEQDDIAADLSDLRERAEAIHAAFRVTPRTPTGIAVCVDVEGV